MQVLIERSQIVCYPQTDRHFIFSATRTIFESLFPSPCFSIPWYQSFLAFMSFKQFSGTTAGPVCALPGFCWGGGSPTIFSKKVSGICSVVMVKYESSVKIVQTQFCLAYLYLYLFNSFPMEEVKLFIPLIKGRSV